MGIISVCSDKGWLSWDCAKAFAGVSNPPKVASPATAAGGCGALESADVPLRKDGAPDPDFGVDLSRDARQDADQAFPDMRPDIKDASGDIPDGQSDAHDLSPDVLDARPDADAALHDIFPWSEQVLPDICCKKEAGDMLPLDAGPDQPWPVDAGPDQTPLDQKILPPDQKPDQPWPLDQGTDKFAWPIDTGPDKFAWPIDTGPDKTPWPDQLQPDKFPWPDTKPWPDMKQPDKCGWGPTKSITETNFTGQTPTDLDVYSGSLTIKENFPGGCTYLYDSSKATYPESQGFATNCPSSWVFRKFHSSGAMWISNMGKDGVCRFEIASTGASSSKGWYVKLVVDPKQVEVISPLTADNPCGFVLGDGLKGTQFRIEPTKVYEYTHQTKTAAINAIGFNNIIVTSKNSSISTYVNPTKPFYYNPTANFTVVPTASAPPTYSDFLWNDIGSAPDNESMWKTVCLYTGGPNLPYKASGSYPSGRISLGAQSNLGTGATITWIGDFPSGAKINFDLYASTGTTQPGTSCGSIPVTTNGTNLIPSSCSGNNLWWKATFLPTTAKDKTPRLDGVIINYKNWQCN